MRPWIIVLLSAAGAMFVAAVLAGPELSDAARSGSWIALLPSLSGLAIAALAVYALCAMLLATGLLLAETLGARHRLGRIDEYRTQPPNDWIRGLGGNGLHHLIPKPVAESIRRAETDGDAVQLLSRFDPDAARREIARLHYIWLARTHFFSALIVLTALVGLGVAQDHGAARLPLDMIPTTPATLILVGLILLAVLSRIAVDVSVEPLVEVISQLPAEDAEIGLLRRAVETLEAAAAAVTSPAPASTLLPDRLDPVIEEGHRVLYDAVRDLSATTDALGATMRSSIDALGDAMNAAAVRPPATPGNGDAGAYKFSELQGAVEALTAVLERLATLPDTADEPLPIGPDLSLRPRAQSPRLARELRKLLQEIETAR
jgi:hypothetical protein